jgi:hypothetical protein
VKRMDRRHFLFSLTNLAALSLTAQTQNTQRIQINIDPDRTLGAIPADFTGLGYEISSVARPGLLSATNRQYVQLVRTLGTHGIIRVGGNTSDYSSFAPTGEAVSAPKATVINEANLNELGTFLEATGWKLIWGLNLGSGTEQQALEEAQAVSVAAKGNLLAFEIGNEPDLFSHEGHKPKGYGYEDYLKEYRRYKSAIRAKLPNAPFAGPDAAAQTDWVTRFATDEGSDLKLLTHHYYRECAKPTSTLDKLLHPDPKLAPELEKLKAASTSSRVPYRICETNSFCGGGKPGVSDTFGAALWALDFMFTLAWAGAVGVNMETGVNQLGFISSYSPIGDDEHGHYAAKPEYYGMLAFAEASQGQQVATNYDPAGANLTAYAVLSPQKRLVLTIINKEPSRHVDVIITTGQPVKGASALRLTGPSLDSKEGIALGGAAAMPDGRWKPANIERLRTQDQGCRLHVPAASAAIVTLQAK